ncbi:hypothetical protein KOR42_35330 [Thalassoglobus neptunius]|uniref:Glycosyltransferase RgtA/B/C/D-like domain-containing protein n=1 Tax=Thalassoglobus neptunius TaxID=1938619 RepID=A0A5C5WN78_9PLAN|nr:hypothetical protein [Thalassoglobus neptunius]TWT51645.1 hypothetical protein KOR42_35330 [Thalassoglobus neptunius]
MKQRVADILVVLLAVAPSYSVYAAHWMQSEGATGFIQYDMPYYSANGREVFENGNGIAGANPFDPQPDAPVVYAQWFPWLLGTAVTQVGIPPEVIFCSIGLIAGVITSWFTLLIVRSLLTHHEHERLVFLLAMWGGGALALAQVVINFITHEHPFHLILNFDLGGGWWFFSWGRNLLLPTEALYHAFVAAAWYCVIKRREWTAVALVTILAATHPFSGVQHLLVMGSWNLFQLLVWKDRQALFRGLTLTVVLGLFLTYYFGFLESFPEHRDLRETWTLNWSVPTIVLLLAYGPVATLAAARLLFQPRTRSPEIWFFVVAGLISFLLIKHDLFITPHQPLHFTRGYVWMPLFLLGLPVIQSLTNSMFHIQPMFLRVVCIAISVPLACFDNICFIGHSTQHPEPQLSLPTPVRDIFETLNEHEATGVFLCADEDVSYLSATFTPVRPYFGHKFNTPDFAERKKQVLAWASGEPIDDWFNPIDLILLRPEDPTDLLPSNNWQLLKESNNYRLYTQSP